MFGSEYYMNAQLLTYSKHSIVVVIIYYTLVITQSKKNGL